MNLRASKFSASALMCAVVLSFVACGPGPKSKQLVELERHLQDPKAREVKDAPGASEPYREARQYRRLALEAWDEGKEERSREYAILGTLKYRTAVAISGQHEASKRLEKANAEVGGANPEIKALNQEQIKLTREVADLQREVAQARRKREEAERRAKAFANQQSSEQQQQADGALRTRLNNEIREAESAKSAADAVNAATHAPDEYNRATNVLKSVQTMLSSSNQATDELVAEASEATTLFQKAKRTAEPKYADEKEKANPTVRRQKLRNEAEGAFGGPYVLPEPAGSRIVLASLFENGSAAIKPNSKRLLEELAKLANKYDEFNIFIEGYTSKRGDATDNLGLSQLRARAVKDYLTSNGVASGRIDTKGEGQDRPRYPRDHSRNERVEVVLSR